MNVMKFLKEKKLIYLVVLLSYMMAFNLYSKPDWKQCLFDESLYKDPRYQFCYPIMLYEAGQIRQMRLCGNYSSDIKQMNPEFPPHGIFMQEGKNERNIPQDPVAALTQWLFLSPDGATLTRNERTGDPVGEITLQQLDNIVQLVISDQAITGQQVLGILRSNSPQQVEKCRQFASILREACMYDAAQKDELYPRGIVCYLLMAFGYSMANNSEELFCLTSIFKQDALQVWKQQKKVFSIQQYDSSIKEFVGRLLQGGESVLPQEIMMYTLGFREFYIVPSPLISQKIFTDEKYKRKIPEYSDCGETFLRNVIYLFLMVNGYIPDAIIEELSKKVASDSPHFRQVIEHIKKYRTLDDSMDAHEDWARCTMGLNQCPEAPEAVSYVKKDNQVEIECGMINMMKVVGVLFPVGELQKKLTGSENENLRQLPAMLNEFCRLLNTQMLAVDWDYIVTGTKNIDKNFGRLVFSRAGKQWMAWDFLENHFLVSPSLEPIKDYWGDSISLDNPNLRNNDVLQLQFVANEKLNSRVFKPYFVWKTPDRFKDAIPIIQYLTQGPDPLRYAALIQMLYYRLPDCGHEGGIVLIQLIALNPTVVPLLFPRISSTSLVKLLRECSNKEETQKVLDALQGYFPGDYVSKILTELKKEAGELILLRCFGQARVVMSELSRHGLEPDLSLSSRNDEERKKFLGATMPADRSQDPQDMEYIINWLITKYRLYYNIPPESTSYPPEWDMVITNAFDLAVWYLNYDAVSILLKSGIWDHKIQKKTYISNDNHEEEQRYSIECLESLLNRTIDEQNSFVGRSPELLRKAERIKTMLHEYEKTMGWQQ